jgi:nucleotide-binding universal stress UspA family protein
MYPFRKILVATEFDSSSTGALDLGSGLAREYLADLVIAHSIEIFVPTYPIAMMPELSSIERDTKEGLDRIVQRVEAVWPRVQGVVLWGSPAEQIIRYAEQHAVDLVVVGTHGRKGPSRWLLGSVAERVTRWCPTPVLTVHEGDDQAKRRFLGGEEPQEVRPSPT